MKLTTVEKICGFGKHSTPVLAAFAALALASQCAAAPATAVVLSATSTSPGGLIFDGARNWIADEALGFCRMDPAGGGGGGGTVTYNLTNCITLSNPPGVAAVFGQPAFDRATGFLYLPDVSTASRGIWRYRFTGNVFNTPVNIAPTAGLGVQQPGAIAVGGDGNLYVSMTANSNIVRVNTPFGASQTVDNMAKTVSGNPAGGLAIVGTQLWVADSKNVIAFSDPVGCGTACKGAIMTALRISLPTAIVWDSVNSLAYFGTSAGVFRHAPLTGVTDLYSKSYVRAGIPGLFSNITGLGVDATGNLFIVDDPTAGQVNGGASVFTVPAGSLPDGQGNVPSPPVTIPPVVSTTAIANPAVLYSNGLTTPTGAVFLPVTGGGHIWVADSARGFCKLNPALPAPSLTACVSLPAGFTPGAPAYDSVGRFAYLPDTTAGGAGILRFPFNTATETLGTGVTGTGVTVVTATTLAAAAPGATAPTALAFGPDNQLYAAMAGTTEILRITAPATASHTVRFIGTMSQAGSPSLAFFHADLYDGEATNSSVLSNATLCTGSCSSLFLAVSLNAVTGLFADANFLYVGEVDKLWRLDPVANTFTLMADRGLVNGTPRFFGPVTGVVKDNLGQIFAIDGSGPVWRMLTAVPAITSLSPSQAPESSSPTVTITGTDFPADVVVNTCPAITPGNVTVVSSTQITATFAINPLGPLGACAVTVTSLSGTSAAATFTVLIGPPALSVITPSSGFRGRTIIGVTITGANLISGGVAGTLTAIPGITVTGTVITSTLVTANFVIDPAATLGPRNIILTTSSGSSNPLTFTVNAAPPVLTSINPSQGVANTNVPVTITGTDLQAAIVNLPAGFSFAPGGTPVVNVAGTSIGATLAIASTVPAGLQNITVTTPGGTSAPVTFKILPALTSINPTLARAGSVTNNVVLSGTSLAGVTTVNAGANITVSNLVAAANSVTVTFTIPAAAPVGPQNVSVTDVNGTSNTVTFTITGPVPVLTNINPVQGGTGATVPVTLTGTGLIGATLILPSGITVLPGTLVNNSFTTVTASLLIAGNAPLGLQTISVSTPGVGNTSNGLGFTVFALAPLLNSISPLTSAAGNTISVTLNGQGFTGTTSVNTLGVGITVPSFTVNAGGTQIVATFVIAANATTQGISVTNPNGTSNSLTFGIVPTLTSISPATGVADQNVPVTLTGTSLTGATVINTGTAGITVTNLVVVNATQITATFAIAAGAVQGNHSISVVTPGGTTAQAVTFNVLPPAPVITSLNNTSISKRSNNVGMNVNGTNLGGLPVSSVSVLLNGVPVGATIVSITNFQPSQTQIRFNWTFLAPAVISGPGNAYTITVTTPSGTSNAFPFTVTN